jgi:hypothetical protein
MLLLSQRFLNCVEGCEIELLQVFRIISMIKQNESTLKKNCLTINFTLQPRPIQPKNHHHGIPSNHLSLNSTNDLISDMGFPFLALPLELRLLIYGQLFRSNTMIHPDFTHSVMLRGKYHWDCKGMALMRTCRQILGEVRRVLYGTNKFHFGLVRIDIDECDDGIHSMIDFFHGIGYVPSMFEAWNGNE